MEHRDGAISTTASSLDCAGPNIAVIYRTKARIEIASVWYSPTSFRVINYKGEVLEEFVETVAACGKQFQAFEKCNALSGLAWARFYLAKAGLIDGSKRGCMGSNTGMA